MWQRIKTAIVLVVIVGVAMFGSRMPILFLPLLSLGVVISAYEWTKLMPKRKHPPIFVAFVLLVTLVSVYFPQSWLIWWGLSLLIWGLATKWVRDYPAKENWYGKRLWTMGVVILVSAITAMYHLWQISAWWLLYVFMLVWCADSGAYFVGRKFGKTKLAPNVSPNKSAEGLYGGILCATVVAVAVAGYLKLNVATFLAFCVLSSTAVGASVLGDLFESMLKRRAGVKDSGRILPGHGGVLDRIDSLLSATPIFAFGLWLCDYFGVGFLG